MWSIIIIDHICVFVLNAIFQGSNKPHAMSRFLSFRALTQSFSWVKFWAAPRGVPSRQIKSVVIQPPLPRALGFA